MRILSLNAGYLLGYRGKPMDYILHPMRAVFGNRGIEEQRMRQLVNLVEKQSPDTVLLQEVDRGSLRDRIGPEISRIHDELEPTYRYRDDLKYSSQIFSYLPIFRYMGNGVLYRQGDVEPVYLGSGMKNLMHRITVDGMEIYSVHLARFGKKIRRKQIEEILGMAGERSLVVGDFNIMEGIDYHRKAIEEKGFSIHSPGETFPASNPERKIDICLSSAVLEPESVERLDIELSDHRPIIVEV